MMLIAAIMIKKISKKMIVTMKARILGDSAIGPLYCYWPTLITLLPTLDDTDDNYDDNKMKEDDYDDQKKKSVDNENIRRLIHYHSYL